jgi:hypothetical protein
MLQQYLNVFVFINSACYLLNNCTSHEAYARIEQHELTENFEETYSFIRTHFALKARTS